MSTTDVKSEIKQEMSDIDDYDGDPDYEPTDGEDGKKLSSESTVAINYGAIKHLFLKFLWGGYAMVGAANFSLSGFQKYKKITLVKYLNIEDA